MQCKVCKIDYDIEWLIIQKYGAMCRMCMKLRYAERRHGVNPVIDGPYLHSIYTPQCPRCGRDFILGDELLTPSLDHKEPDGGHAIWNIWIICKQCNRQKGERPYAADQFLIHHPDYSWCSMCRNCLPKSRFRKNLSARTGIAYRCRACERERNRLRRAGVWPPHQLRQDEASRYQRAYIAQPEQREKARQRMLAYAASCREANRTAEV